MKVKTLTTESCACDEPAEPDQDEGKEAEAQPVDENSRPPHEQVLEEEDPGQRADGGHQNADVERPGAPDPLPERRRRQPRADRPDSRSMRRRRLRRGLRRIGHDDRRLLVLEVLVRQRIVAVEASGRPCRSAPTARCTRSWSRQGCGRIEADVRRDDEQADLLECRCAGGGERRRGGCDSGRGSGSLFSPWTSSMRSKMPPRT